MVLPVQDTVLLPEGFTEYIYHVGNEKELRSIVNHVFFSIVNPMDDQDGFGETQCDLSQARIAPYRNTWKPFQNTVFWCNLKLTQQRGLQFLSTKVKRSYPL